MRWAVLIACLALARVAAALPIDVDGDGKPDADLPWEGAAVVTSADAAGHRVLLVRGAERAWLGEWTAGKLVELWSGRLGPQDVDGEWRREIDLGPPDVLLYETRPEVTRCDGTPARIYPRRLDIPAGKWVPVALVPEPPARTVAASRTAPPGLEKVARPQVFAFEAATATADDGGSAEGLTAPRELDDGKRDTAWSVAPASVARGVVFVARASTARGRVLALRVVGGDAQKGTSRPRRLLVTVGGQATLFELPDVAAPLWLVLPQPMASSCVDVVIDAVHGAGRRVAISELAVFSDVDAGGERALAELALAVAAGGPGAPDAEHHLLGRGAAGATALLDAARAAAGPDERRRLRLALARAGDARAAGELAAGLAAATRAEDADAFAEGLRALGDAAVPALVPLVGDEQASPPARVRGARVLGGTTGVAAREALVAVCGRGPRDLRQAVIVALAARPAADAAPLLAAAQLPSAHPDLWRAVALHARRLPPEGRAVVAAAAAARLDGAATPLRYRLLQALAVLGDEASLARALAAEPDPALRTAALEALAGGETILVRAVDDADPGVRATAAAGLAARPEVAAADQPLLGRLAGDGWPMVRRAVAGALAARCRRSPAADGLYHAVRADGDEGVRRAALAGLVRCREQRVGGELVAVARDRAVSPSLRAYAAMLLGQLGDKGRVPDLVALLQDARDDALAAPDPVAADGAIRRAAAAAHALGQLADARAAPALLDAARDGAFPAVQAAAITAVSALGVPCPAGAREVIGRMVESDDALVGRAARMAADRCGLPGGAAP